MKAEFICMEEPAYFAMIDRVLAYVEEKHRDTKQDQWVSKEIAMELLNITSKTTLQDYRDMGKIRFSQPSPKKFLYDRYSIYEFLENS